MSLSTWPTSVLVTGATGFIGRPLVRALVAQGCEVGALVLPEDPVTGLDGVRRFEGDLTVAESVQAAVMAFRPRAVMHLAAVGMASARSSPVELCQVNVMGTLHLLEAVREAASVERLVCVGSSYEYGARRADDGLDPFSPYSASKVAAWAFARAAFNAWGAPVVWARPFQVYGPGQHPAALVPAAMRAACAGEDFPMTRGEQQRDFIYVDDVVGGLMAALRAPDLEGRVLDLGTGTLHRLYDVVAQIWALAQAPGQIRAGALPYRPGEVTAIPADVQRTRLLTGWTAQIPLRQGLVRTLRALCPGVWSGDGERAEEMSADVSAGLPKEVEDVG